MTISPTNLEPLLAFGYSEEEARFLYLVATYSGYFTSQQFLAFARARSGKRSSTLRSKLEIRGHVRIEKFPLSGAIYHLVSHTFYRLVQRNNFRHGQAHEIAFIKKRLAILDFVIAHQCCEFLEAEADKLNYFCDTLGIDKQFLPSRMYVGRADLQSTLHYFVDGFPIFFAPNGSSRILTFTYVPEHELGLTDFRRHLERYVSLFRHLTEFRFLYVARTSLAFAKAQELFDSVVRVPFQPNVSLDLLRYFRIRRAWEAGQYATLSDDDLVFRNQARERFYASRFHGLYRSWKGGTVDDERIRQLFVGDERTHSMSFEAYQIETPTAERGKEPRNETKKEKHAMPIVKKAPAIMTREVKLEEPVNELLDDYARFIESTADHVVNSVLKTVLWRDQDYRKWRLGRHSAQSSQANNGGTP